VFRDFAVQPVTRDTIGLYDRWPAVGETSMPWMDRVARPNDRIIAPGDMLGITIWDTEENGLLTTPGQRFVPLPEIRVSSGGSIFLPYLGEMKISGLTPEAARAQIEDRYLAVTPSVQVQLQMTEGRQSTVSLVSGVAKPGAYPLPDQDFTVMELVAEGGGVAQNLINPQIRLYRGSRVYGTSVDRLMATPALNTTLQAGDKVGIEEDSRYFLSLGAAGVEAQHRFPQDKVTALDAMSIIGGLSETRANPQGILILRRYPQSAVRADGSGPRHARTIFTVDLTSADGLFSAGQFQVRPGDLVYVTESPLNNTRTVVGLIGSIAGLSAIATN